MSLALYSMGGAGSSIIFVLKVLLPCLYSRISSSPFFIFCDNVLMALCFFDFFDEFLEEVFVFFGDGFLLILPINHYEK